MEQKDDVISKKNRMRTYLDFIKENVMLYAAYNQETKKPVYYLNTRVYVKA